MQFLFTLQAIWRVNSFARPISSFISFHLTIYLFKSIDIRDRTPNWQDYHIHVSGVGMCLYLILLKVIRLKRTIGTRAREFIGFKLKISVSGYRITLWTHEYMYFNSWSKDFPNNVFRSFLNQSLQENKSFKWVEKNLRMKL